MKYFHKKVWIRDLSFNASELLSLCGALTKLHIALSGVVVGTSSSSAAPLSYISGWSIMIKQHLHALNVVFFSAAQYTESGSKIHGRKYLISRKTVLKSRSAVQFGKPNQHPPLKTS